VSDKLVDSVLKVGAAQQPPSGWEPGLSSNIQLRTENTGDVLVSTKYATAQFFINNELIGEATRFDFVREIKPNKAAYQENNAIVFPREFAERIKDGPLFLRVRVFGSRNGKPIEGAFDMEVKISDLPGPLKLVEGRHVGLELMESNIDGVKNLEKTLDFLDEAYDSMAEFTGQQPLEGRMIVLREVPDFFAWAIAGFPILLSSKNVRKSITDFDEGKICFGWLHEMGHNFEYGYWYMYNGPACEFHANFKVLYAIEHLFRGDTGFAVLHSWKSEDDGRSYRDGREWSDHHFLNRGDAYLADPNRDWLSLQSNELLSFHLRLVRQYGWGPYRRMYRTYRAFNREGLPKPEENSATEMTKLQMAILGHHLGIDIVPILQQWRIPVTKEDIDEKMKSYRIADMFLDDRRP